MSTSEDAALLGDQFQLRPSQPQLFTRIGLAIKHFDYKQLYRRQPMKGIGGAFNKMAQYNTLQNSR